jgi:hypothetical protein
VLCLRAVGKGADPAARPLTALTRRGTVTIIFPTF